MTRTFGVVAAELHDRSIGQRAAPKAACEVLLMKFLRLIMLGLEEPLPWRFAEIPVAYVIALAVVAVIGTRELQPGPIEFNPLFD